MNTKHISGGPPSGPRKGIPMVAAVAGLSLALGACGGGSGEEASPTGESENGSTTAGTTLVVSDWGGAIQDAELEYLYRPFEEETGVKVVIAEPPSTAKIKAMVDANNVEWDLVAGGFTNVFALGRDYFEEIPAEYSNVEGVPEEFIDPNAVAYYVFSNNIGWNAEAFGGDRMESWADFWDFERFPGNRTLSGSDGGNRPFLEAALLADGVAIEDLYPLDLDRAFAKLEELKPHVPQWWSSGSQPGQMLVSNQVSAAQIWSGRVFTLQQEGAPIDHTWNQGRMEPATWMIPKGSKNKQAALELIRYSLQPEVQARLWGNYPASPTNLLAVEQMDPEYAKTLSTHPDNYAVQFMSDYEWWSENEAEVLQRWDRFILSD